MGRYPPLGFVPAGVGTLIGPSDAGVRAARVSAAIVSCALLALAGTILRRRKRSLVPLLAAATPGVFFLSSVSSPSGLEITAATVAWVALWVAVAESWQVRSTIAVFVVGTSLLVIARPAGVVTVAVMLLAALITDQRALLAAVARAWRHFAWLAGALIVSGAWYVAIYDANFGVQVEIDDRVTTLSTIVSRSLNDLPRLVGESIGNFGWLDTPSPTIVVWMFVSITVALMWRTLTDGGRRERVALAFVIVVVPIWLIALNRNYQDLLGTFGAQGRHLTPFLIGIPLAASMRRGARSSDQVLLGAFVVVHLWCVLVALRRYAVGAGGDDWLAFVRDPIWTPPLGMATTLGLVAVGHIAAWSALRTLAGRMEQ
jgi:hypothetical protein